MPFVSEAYRLRQYCEKLSRAGPHAIVIQPIGIIIARGTCCRSVYVLGATEHVDTSVFGVVTECRYPGRECLTRRFALLLLLNRHLN